MSYLYELPNSTSGMDTILVDTVKVIPSLPPLILAFVFFFVFLGGISRQRYRIGTADYPMWAVIASVTTLLLALVMSTSPGLIRLDWLVIIVVITIFSGVWFFLDRKASEV